MKAHLMRFGVAVVGLMVAGGCSTGDTQEPGSEPDDGSALLPDAGARDQQDAGAPAPPAEEEGPRVAREVTARSAELAPSIDGNNGFAWALYDELRGEPGNLFFSPFSIYAALSMTYAGARGSTAAQLHDVLRITGDDAQHHAAFGALLRDLNGEKEGRGYELDIANRVYAKLGLEIEQSYLDLVETDYDAPLGLLDFADDPEAARSTINEWVAEQTRDLIQQLLPPGSITQNTAMVLANAIYFHARWARQFQPELTADAPFTRPDGSEVTVPMMRAADVDARWAQDFSTDGPTAVLELDYRDREVSFVVILPPSYDRLEVAEQLLVTGGYDALLATGFVGEIEVQMPRFELRHEFPAAEPLQALGATDMFCNAAPDLSGIASESLCVDDVFHQAFISVDEEGTVAAAATAVTVGVLLAPPSFRVDRPFVFAIRDKLTGTILFLGRVEDPMAG